MAVSRREFVLGVAAAAVSTKMIAQKTQTCPFRLAVINDEIGTDFERSCHIAAHDFGLSWIEIRTLWGKSLTDASADQVAEAKKILAKYNLKVTDLASPLFKTDLPGAPSSKSSTPHDTFHSDVPYKEQDELLEKLIDLSKTFGTDRIRCFDFWRLQDQKPWRAEINRKLIEASEKCAKHDLILLLENEMACNTGSGPEAAALLAAIPNKNFMLNWDLGNSGTFPGDVPYPNDYEKLPKHRIGHVHCKNVKRTPGGKAEFQWQPVDVGLVDWVGQFKALKRDGYHYAVSLETHWRGGPGDTPDAIAESSTRISMKGLKDCLGKAGISC
ncbi:sugar phosphate isomerase/epimerase family protein [Granulicella mallensis]|uniref:Xylose isomerase domain-containing protein TIM barrel n=1 Tax=Granulicella mallensis (strain ATCC BAA-1857 / DSM 23137 / MP5ACTX8) TaxID=682795 RepID=G8P0V6_GRAMM|nr:sugar phosphate isomerase/epimerase family protein [Granulicella mallensis]AEU35803.1 Xylose isomerase domain-containing protein TIM barrel [Granulicella mallensis MP5ACTX8]